MIGPGDLEYFTNIMQSIGNIAIVKEIEKYLGKKLHCELMIKEINEIIYDGQYTLLSVSQRLQVISIIKMFLKNSNLMS